MTIKERQRENEREKEREGIERKIYADSCLPHKQRHSMIVVTRNVADHLKLKFYVTI